MFALCRWNATVWHITTRDRVPAHFIRDVKQFLDHPCADQCAEQNGTGFVAPAIARSHSCLFITMWVFKSTAQWVRISMWGEFWLLAEVTVLAIPHIPGIIDVRELSYAFGPAESISIYERRWVLLLVQLFTDVTRCHWPSS